MAIERENGRVKSIGFELRIAFMQCAVTTSLVLLFLKILGRGDYGWLPIVLPLVVAFAYRITVRRVIARTLAKRTA